MAEENENVEVDEQPSGSEPTEIPAAEPEGAPEPGPEPAAEAPAAEPEADQVPEGEPVAETTAAEAEAAADGPEDDARHAAARRSSRTAASAPIASSFIDPSMSRRLNFACSNSSVSAKAAPGVTSS